MKKAMLSQPMAGKTEKEIVETRERAIAALKERGYEIVNTLFTDEWYSDEAMKERGVVQIPLCFLAKSLENMSLCHAAYFCAGWENARGCRIEHEAAKAYGLEVLYEEDDMANETFYALVENGVVTNVMVLYPPSAAEFEGAVPCGDLPVAVGDTYDGEHFYRGGEKLDSPLAVAQQEAQTLKEDIPMLKAQIQAISDRNDFVEDCIAEMATVVYAEKVNVEGARHRAVRTQRGSAAAKPATPRRGGAGRKEGCRRHRAVSTPQRGSAAAKPATRRRRGAGRKKG